MGCPQLSLHDQLPSPKERPQDKKNEIHVSEPGEIPLSASRPNSSVDNNNRRSQKSSNNDQCLLEVEPGKNYSRCVWCSDFSSHRGEKETISFNPKRGRPTSVSSGNKWKCDSKQIKVGIRELCGNECLDIFMSVQTRYPNKVSNDINSLEKHNTAMRELPRLSGLVEATKNNCGYRELQPEHEWLIDQENKEYFYDAYGITDINPLLEDDDGMSVLFLDSRGILFEWCELTQDMYILGINEMEGFANILYHPEKKCIIIKDTGEIIPDKELERQAEESAKAEYANIVKAK
jgi:hypothetical protein